MSNRKCGMYRGNVRLQCRLVNSAHVDPVNPSPCYSERSKERKVCQIARQLNCTQMMQDEETKEPSGHRLKLNKHLSSFLLWFVLS